MRLWDIKTDKERRTFLGHTGQVESVRFSPMHQLMEINISMSRLETTSTTWKTTNYREAFYKSDIVKLIRGR